MWHNVSYVGIENVYLHVSGNSAASLGLVNGNQAIYQNVHVNTGSQSSTNGLVLNGASSAINCEVWSGSLSPTGSGSVGIYSGDGSNAIIGCRVHHCRDVGIRASGYGDRVENNLVYANVGNGIEISPVGGNFVGTCRNNTVNGNSGHGISVGSLVSTLNGVFGNLLTNQVGGSKCGLNVAAGTEAAVTALRDLYDFNFYYNNTSHRSSNLTAGTNDVTLSADPYTNAAGFDFSLNSTASGGAAVRSVGYPKLIGTYDAATGGTRAAFSDGGAIQHQSTGISVPVTWKLSP